MAADTPVLVVSVLILVIGVICMGMLSYVVHQLQTPAALGTAAAAASAIGNIVKRAADGAPSGPAIGPAANLLGGAATGAATGAAAGTAVGAAAVPVLKAADIQSMIAASKGSGAKPKYLLAISATCGACTKQMAELSSMAAAGTLKDTPLAGVVYPDQYSGVKPPLQPMYVPSLFVVKEGAATLVSSGVKDAAALRALA
jgi:hypothetical protein